MTDNITGPRFKLVSEEPTRVIVTITRTGDIMRDGTPIEQLSRLELIALVRELVAAARR